ncbi:10524_t:CDS:2 [Funneliformis mosseae]|uniref:10524_t:CDS:1 n=1 Tax=Funneliformis mosseae TaxID=27381 RepID=A0A9N9HNR6_FUNMO|nr:10524_t:CDS:2 [Funneliformis mosseae]
MPTIGKDTEQAHSLKRIINNRWEQSTIINQITDHINDMNINSKNILILIELFEKLTSIEDIYDPKSIHKMIKIFRKDLIENGYSEKKYIITRPLPPVIGIWKRYFRPASKTSWLTISHSAGYKGGSIQAIKDGLDELGGSRANWLKDFVQNYSTLNMFDCTYDSNFFLQEDFDHFSNYSVSDFDDSDDCDFDTYELNKSKRQFFQPRTYKYFSRPNVPTEERLISCETLSPDSFVVRKEEGGFMHFRNIHEMESYINSIPEFYQTFHEYICKGRLQKIKLDLDGDIEKLASYPDPLSQEYAKNLLTGSSIPCLRSDVAKQRLSSWKKMSLRDRKTDEIVFLIKKGLYTLIKKLTGRCVSSSDILKADSSNNFKWSLHIILSQFFVNGATKARKFIEDLFQILPSDFSTQLRSLKILDEGVNKDYQSFRMAGCHKIANPTRVKKIVTEHSWRDSLITYIEGNAVELYPFLDLSSEELSLHTSNFETLSDRKKEELSDQIIKIVEDQFPFLSFRNHISGRDNFDHLQPSLCDICNSAEEHTSDGMYGKWIKDSYYLFCYRQTETGEPLKVFEADC